MMAVSCSEHLEFQSPVGFADGDFSEPTADVGLLLRRQRPRSVGHVEPLRGDSGGAAGRMNWSSAQ